ncbi:hypothetical protein [Pseudonocardia xishanensis]|uniref:Uncharacterized protein n=1 Tax=Pseudonocardia xishanensis TaxID=630995 RepID=A0ABP8S4D3_9PSEU
MYFRITAADVELVDPADVQGFSAVVPADLPPEDLAASVARHELGEVLPGGEHLMIPLETVRRLAEGRVGPDWPADFEKMIAYAASKGWTSADGTAVRAHVERG